jgi:hypothetical protein
MEHLDEREGDALREDVDSLRESIRLERRM